MIDVGLLLEIVVIKQFITNIYIMQKENRKRKVEYEKSRKEKKNASENEKREI